MKCTGNNITDVIERLKRCSSPFFLSNMSYIGVYNSICNGLLALNILSKAAKDFCMYVIPDFGERSRGPI